MTPLEVMKSLAGTQWSSGGPTPTILAWDQFIAQAFPDMASYILGAEHGYSAWCGRGCGYCVAKCGIRPPFGSTDVERFLYALSWRSWGSDASGDPQQGDIAVFDFGGGDHHVSIIDQVNPTTLDCWGANQSHQVDRATFKRSSVVAVRRAPTAVAQPIPAPTPTDDLPFLQLGSVGVSVGLLQALLKVPQTDTFDAATDAAVRAYQRGAHLEVDGQVGPLTWASLAGWTSAQQAPASSSSLSAGAQIYLKLLTKFQASNVNGVTPPDGAQFGITIGAPDQWARFGTACCDAESNFNPHAANTSDPGGSFGIFQYAHNQVPGGNAYDIDASISAFVRDAESSVKSGSLQNGILGKRFSTIGRHPDRTIAKLPEAAKLAAEAQKVITMPDQPAPGPAPAPTPIPPPPEPVPTPTPAPAPIDLKALIEAQIQQIISTIGPTVIQAILAAVAKQIGVQLPASALQLPAPSSAPTSTPSTNGNTMDWTHTALGGLVASVFAQQAGMLGSTAIGTTSWGTILTMVFGVLSAAGVLPKLPGTIISVLNALWGQQKQ